MVQIIPSKMKQVLSRALGVDDLNRQVNVLFQIMEENTQTCQALADRSRERWKTTKPLVGLTWGKSLSGDNFVAKVSSYEAFAADKNILEIGPGYGRLLKSVLKSQTLFKIYLGLDISKENVEFLTKTYASAKVGFTLGDVEKTSLESKYDIVLSSLTLKHIFPSFEKSLANIANYLNSGAMLFFDLIEGKQEYFENDRVTFIRMYSKEEVSGILDRVGLQLVKFDTVWHDKQHPRLLVVAKKP
jgi:SAM-dependent methyltransferase